MVDYRHLTIVALAIFLEWLRLSSIERYTALPVLAVHPGGGRPEFGLVELYWLYLLRIYSLRDSVRLEVAKLCPT